MKGDKYKFNIYSPYIDYLKEQFLIKTFQTDNDSNITDVNIKTLFYSAIVYFCEGMCHIVLAYSVSLTRHTLIKSNTQIHIQTGKIYYKKYKINAEDDKIKLKVDIHEMSGFTSSCLYGGFHIYNTIEYLIKKGDTNTMWVPASYYQVGITEPKTYLTRNNLGVTCTSHPADPFSGSIKELFLDIGETYFTIFSFEPYFFINLTLSVLPTDCISITNIERLYCLKSIFKDVITPYYRVLCFNNEETDIRIQEGNCLVTQNIDYINKKIKLSIRSRSLMSPILNIAANEIMILKDNNNRTCSNCAKFMFLRINSTFAPQLLKVCNFNKTMAMYSADNNIHDIIISIDTLCHYTRLTFIQLQIINTRKETCPLWNITGELQRLNEFDIINQCCSLAFHIENNMYAFFLHNYYNSINTFDNIYIIFVYTLSECLYINQSKILIGSIQLIDLNFYVVEFVKKRAMFRFHADVIIVRFNSEQPLDCKLEMQYRNDIVYKSSHHQYRRIQVSYFICNYTFFSSQDISQ